MSAVTASESEFKNGRSHVEAMYGRIILKWISNGYAGLWTELMWPGGDNGHTPFSSRKVRRSWDAVSVTPLC